MNNDEKKKNFIKAEEVCYLLNSELGSDVFTVIKLKRLCKQGLIKCHDLRMPGSKLARNFYIFEEVKECLQSLKK